MINFNEINASFSTIVPVKNKSFIYNRKRYSALLDDGWYWINIKGNEILMIK